MSSGGSVQTDFGVIAAGEARGAWTEEGAAARSRSWARRHAADIVASTTSVVASTAFATYALELWRANLRIPLYYAYDGLLMLMFVKDLLSGGWWLTNSHLGAPYGQELYDFPLAAGNLLHVLGIDALGLVLRDPSLTLNVYYLLGYPLTALSAYFVLRRLEVTPLVACVVSVVFSTLPYHFGRGADHLFLSAYFTVPIACYLVTLAFGGRPLFAWPTTWRKTAMFLATVLGCVAIGTASTYYAAFAVSLLIAGGLVSLVAHRGAGSLPHAALAAALVLATVAASLAPVFLYRQEHGSNDSVAVRAPEEAELLSLRLSELVLPVRGHRLAPLAELRELYETRTPLPSESNQALGLVATIGLLALLVVGVATAAGRRWQAGPVRVLPALAAATLVAVLISTTGGLSTVVSYAGLTQLRGWNRMSIFIAFFALAAVAILLDAVRALVRGRMRRALFAVALTVVPALALFDQTNARLVPPHAVFQAAWASDEGFVRSIERTLPEGASVFQLPYVSFPEEPRPPGAAAAYDELVGYLHSDRLRWSFGAMRGRDADWAGTLAEKPPDVVVLAIAASGFAGAEVDTLAYDDAGSRVLRVLEAHGRPVYSADGRLAFVDLRSYGAELRRTLPPESLEAVRLLTLQPVRSRWSGAFWPTESDGASTWRWTRSRTVSIELDNPGRSLRDVRVTLTLASGVDEPSRAVVRWPYGPVTRVAISSEGTRITERLALRPGRSTIVITTDARDAARLSNDARDHLYLRITDPRFRDVTFADAFPRSSPAVALFEIAPREER
jgi:hypothetical protein